MSWFKDQLMEIAFEIYSKNNDISFNDFFDKVVNDESFNDEFQFLWEEAKSLYNAKKMMKFELFKTGEIAILDKDFQNTSKVKVISQSEPSRMYTFIQSIEGDHIWEVMTNRLTKIKDTK